MGELHKGFAESRMLEMQAASGITIINVTLELGGVKGHGAVGLMGIGKVLMWIWDYILRQVPTQKKGV
jgi:hypothetical protein